MRSRAELWRAAEKATKWGRKSARHPGWFDGKGLENVHHSLLVERGHLLRRLCLLGLLSTSHDWLLCSRRLLLLWAPARATASASRSGILCRIHFGSNANLSTSFADV